MVILPSIVCTQQIIQDLERCGTKNEKCNKNELAIYDTLTVSHQIFYTFCYSSDLHSDINLAMKITFVSNSFQTSLLKLKKGFATK